MKKPINEIERLKLIAGLINEVEYNDSVYGVKRTTLTEGKKKKEVKELSIDVANPYEYRMGLQYELEQMDDYSNESLEKAKSIVLKNLAKDVNFYTTLLNQDQSPYKFEAPETDKPGMQARPDGFLKKELKKDEKANVQDTLGKKESGKKKPKGVKVMPNKGVEGKEKVVKEGLDEDSKDPYDKAKVMKVKDKFEVYTTQDGKIKTFDTEAEAKKFADEHNKKNVKENVEEGVVNEIILKVYRYDPSSNDLEDVDVEYFGSEDEAKKAALAHHWQIAFDNGDTELSKDEFVAQTDWNNFEPYDNYSYDIVPDKGNIKEELDEIMPGVNLGASFDKLKGEMNAEDEFNSLMSKYDWYYEMSDDPRAYDRGTAMNSKLKMLGKQIGIDKAVELFNTKAPSDRKITSSFFMEGEDKHSKIKEALKAALKKALKEEDPAMVKLDRDEEAAEKALATILKKKADILNKPGTQG
jgi:hypothetical protein